MNRQEVKKQILERGIKSLMDEAKVPMKIANMTKAHAANPYDTSLAVP